MCSADTDTSVYTTTPLVDSGTNDWLVQLRPLHFDENADINYPQLITFSVEYSNIENLNHKIIKLCDPLRRIATSSGRTYRPMNILYHLSNTSQKTTVNDVACYSLYIQYKCDERTDIVYIPLSDIRIVF